MQFRDKQIAPPKDWSTFENLCHALFKKVWADPYAQKNGRSGQNQHGVDVFGSSNGEAVQCKGKNSNYGSEASWAEVTNEVAKADTYSPPLKKWIFATTAPVDGKLQQAARELTAERKAKGLFSVTVLGWEEVQVLMASVPEVIFEFYPEHMDNLPQILMALEALPSIQENLSGLVRNLKEKKLEPSLYRSAIWEIVSFDDDRGLGPALMGYSLGPADAVACPRLTEVDTVIERLKIAYSTRLVGEPGAGKSICSYQAAKELAADGFKVQRLLDPQLEGIALEPLMNGGGCLYLIDEAHLLSARSLKRLEDQAGPTSLLLSTHNAVTPDYHRGTITLDAKRAVKTIAAALRTDLTKTLEAVCQADDSVGDRMMDASLCDRIDDAERTSNVPWQFCFVLGGGWRRSKQAADSARAANTDLVLAAVASRQLVSRDARTTPKVIEELCLFTGNDAETVQQGLEWLEKERLIVGTEDCRTPHQRFASVVLNRILEGQDDAGRDNTAKIIESLIVDPQYPYAGLRSLTHELRFGSSKYSWRRLLGQSAIEVAVDRCWAANGPDRGFAALALADLWGFAEGGARAVIKPNVATLAAWISDPNDSASGLGLLLNNLAQEDRDVAEAVVTVVDPIALAGLLSNVEPYLAHGLGDLLRSVANVRAGDYNARLLAALDQQKLVEFSQHTAFRDDALLFTHFCSAILLLDDNLALEMAERFTPTAQQILARDPMAGFAQLWFDFASTVLRVVDPLHVYVGKLKPTRRRWKIARRMCDKLDPLLVAQQVSTVLPRHFQTASMLLNFLMKASPRKYDAVLRHLDWDKLDSVIGDDWVNMPHETEVLLATLYSQPNSRQLVQFISDRADRIVHLTPRLLIMAPKAGLSHLEKGGSLRLGQYNHIDWKLGCVSLRIIAESQPELIEQAVSPFVDNIANGLTSFNRSHVGPAAGFVQVVIDHAPIAWREVLDKLDLDMAEENLAVCLKMDADHRLTAAAIIGSSVLLDGPVGEMARRLRARFPKASIVAA